MAVMGRTLRPPSRRPERREAPRLIAGLGGQREARRRSRRRQGTNRRGYVAGDLDRIARRGTCVTVNGRELRAVEMKDDESHGYSWSTAS
jgi:hypothetical protein